MQEFRELTKSQGWEQLVKYAEGQIKSRAQGKDTVTGMDQMVSNSIIDAEISGIQLFLRIPELAIQDFEEQLDELKEEIHDAAGND